MTAARWCCAALIAALVVPWACAPKRPTSKPMLAQAEQTYVCRARVVMLPAKGPPPVYLTLHHEEIPDLVDRTGAVVGMKEMTMPFPNLADGLSLEGINIGDAIEFTLEVRWRNDPRTLITRIVPLAPGTALNFANQASEGR